MQKAEGSAVQDYPQLQTEACITGDPDCKQNQTDVGVVVTVEKQSYIKYFKVI